MFVLKWELGCVLIPAVEFMWDNVVESMDKLKDSKDPGQGCILAHCMGLGKTLSVRQKVIVASCSALC